MLKDDQNVLCVFLWKRWKKEIHGRLCIPVVKDENERSARILRIIRTSKLQFYLTPRNEDSRRILYTKCNSQFESVYKLTYLRNVQSLLIYWLMEFRLIP